MAAHVNGSTNDRVLEPEEITIPVPWGHISAKWWGPRDVQPILGLHGWQDNAGTWDRLAPLLPPGQALLALDLMGHGLSSHYPKGQFYFLYWDGVMLVRRVCRLFGWDKVTIIGHSQGGAIGFLYAANYPDRVSKLICIDIASPVPRPDEKVVERSGYIMEKFLDYEEVLGGENMPSYTYEEVVQLVMKAYGSVTRESCEILLKRGIERSPNGSGFHFTRDVRLKISGLGSISSSTIFLYATKITCEVLNIKGKPDNSLQYENFYHKVIELMKTSAKRVEFYEVEESHHLHLNNPELVMPYIANFLLDNNHTD